MRGRGSRVFFVEMASQIAPIVEQLGGSSDAIAEGRVFVDGRRCVDPALRLRPGQRLELHEARADQPQIQIVDRSAGLVAVDKPAGISTEPDRRGGASLLRAAAQLLGVPMERIHACSRLDFGVSGVVLLALDADAQQRVARARARGELRRRYVALAGSAPSPERGRWLTPVDGRSAETRYELVEHPARADAQSRPALLALEPVTGRTHQLRAHAAAAGAALLGDRAYGGATRWVLPNGAVRALPRVYLHAAWVRLAEPAGTLRFASPIPGELSELFAELGGDAAAWSRALDDAILAPG
jgi:23S rRNA-/tRNA-specific pseudouridylate synthase